MKASVYHVQINVAQAGGVAFYRDLLGHLEFRPMVDVADCLGMTNGGTDVWIIETPAQRKAIPFHRKNAGLNHVAFRVARRADVDGFRRDFLDPRKIAPLYDSPREYPEYRPGYYAVFFEGPDRLKLEVAYVP
jgi:catechol 2,3-dioxygenase-like lactoylglutathione lyase family enzyme